MRLPARMSRRIKHADYVGQLSDPYQRASARTARRRGASSGICLANPRTTLELALHSNVKSRARLAGGLFQSGVRPVSDALATASGKPYTQLFEEKITRPLGMKDTTFTPSPDQCKRLMVQRKAQAPVIIRWQPLAAAGSILRQEI